jgi:3-oxoacyl-[acyl-carrier-protein] synthase II
MTRRVVVTGLGMVCPVGLSTREAWDNALNARSGVAKITRFDSDAINCGVNIAAEVKNFQIGDALDAKEANRTSRFVQYAAKAAQEAFQHARLQGSYQAERAGCAIGVGLGSLEDIEEHTNILRDKGPRRVSPFFLPYTIPNMAAGVVSRALNLKGPNMCTTTACTSGTHGAGEGWLHKK